MSAEFVDINCDPVKAPASRSPAGPSGICSGVGGVSLLGRVSTTLVLVPLREPPPLGSHCSGVESEPQPEEEEL